MNLKTIVSYIYNLTSWLVIVGFGLKSLIEFLPQDIRKWLVEIPNYFVGAWFVCLILVFLSSAIYILFEYRTEGISKKFWSVLSTIAILFLVIGSLAYMTSNTLNGLKEVNSFPYPFPDGFQAIEQVISSEAIPLKDKAQLTQHYAQFIYIQNGQILDVLDESGSLNKYIPTDSDLTTWNGLKKLYIRGERLTKHYITLNVYALVALMFGLLIGAFVPKNRITKRSTRTS
jgi:hypothetical protein